MENNNNNNNKALLLDVSSFLLVEGSADSEADHVNMACDGCDGGDDDDAESCSCGDTPCQLQVDACYDDDDEEEEDCCSSSFNIGATWEPIWSNNTCKMWLREASSMEVMASDDDKRNNCAEKQKFGFKLSREAMDEMEDRLFWEACIAIGYP